MVALQFFVIRLAFFYVSSGSVTLALFLSETDAPNGLIIIFVTLFFTFGNGFGNYLYV